MLTKVKNGQLALAYCNKHLPAQVLRSAAGYYIGTADEDGPCSRESTEYWQHPSAAVEALENGTWTQRDEP